MLRGSGKRKEVSNVVATTSTNQRHNAAKNNPFAPSPVVINPVVPPISSESVLVTVPSSVGKNLWKI